jgi:dihydroneopterin aldolase
MAHSLETILSIDDIRVKAFHGWYEAERKIGGMYCISAKAYNTVESNCTFSDMDDSINYEGIHSMVIGVMQEEFKLIEHCCKTLFDGLKAINSSVIWEVSLVKEDVPIKHVGRTSFTIKG